VSGDQTWWGRRWLSAVEGRAQLDPNRLPRAKRYARSGAVADLRIGPGEVRATVAGRDNRPYEVRIRVRQFTDNEWRNVLEAIARQVVHAAALLEGDLPTDIGAAVEGTGLSLLPGPVEIGPRCTCPDDADPCKHSAAVCYLVADALDADPFVALLLRGRTREEVLAGLRARRRDEAERAGRLAPDDSHGEAHPSTPPGPPEPEAAPGDAPDPGLDARQVLAATAWGPIPNPPAPPRRPGRPVAWPVDPPAELAALRTDLIALATDAVHRAWELAVGAAPGAWLGVDADADLARRADRALGTPGFATLASRSGVTERELARWALAWRHGGPTGIEVLRRRWDPTTESEAGATHLLVAARSALGGPAAGARIRGDRVTAAGHQLRLGRDYRWYPYHRISGHWEPAGPAATQPDAAVALTWPKAPEQAATPTSPTSSVTTSPTSTLLWRTWTREGS
jgi:uncharacterized Zn finger protein